VTPSNPAKRFTAALLDPQRGKGHLQSPVRKCIFGVIKSPENVSGGWKCPSISVK